MKYSILIGMLVGAIALTSCEKKNTESSVTLSDSYTLTNTGLYPEGIDYDSQNNRFVIGSFYQGKVYTLSPEGKLTEFITNPLFTAILGVYTDETRNRLIVLSGDAGASINSGMSTAGSKALVSIYNLTTGVLIKDIDLKSLNAGGGDFPNDAAVDDAGNIYVTNSFSPIIYKIDTNNVPTVFVNNATLFTPKPSSFGLNGIVYRSGYLIVAKTDSGQLFKIPISNPAAAKEITGVSVKSPDGLEWSADNKLIVVENGLSGGIVYTLSSTDDWSSSTQTITKTIGSAAFPTTVALATNNKVYVLSSKLGNLLSGDKIQDTFFVQSIN